MGAGLAARTGPRIEGDIHYRGWLRAVSKVCSYANN